MPKDTFKNSRLIVEYDPADPKEHLEMQRKQLKGKAIKDLTPKEKDDLLTATLAVN